MSTFLIIAIVLISLFFGGVTTFKKALRIVDNTLDKANKALDVSDIYLDNWAEDAKDAAAIASAKRKNELQREVAALNTELAAEGKETISVPSSNKKAITLPSKK